jgi:putative IMPACT (imprinted ancient) family translation regulator
MEAQKELEVKKSKITRKILDIENMVEANILLEKIKKLRLDLKDNILLKRYSNYVSYSKISTDLEQLKDSLKRKII